MRIAHLPLLLLMVAVPFASGCTAKLPPSSERLLLRRLHAEKIIAVRDVRRRNVGAYDYLGFFGTFEVTWSFEAWYHPEVILRKKRADSDWSHAELFHAGERIEPLFALPDAQFETALSPWTPND